MKAAKKPQFFEFKVQIPIPAINESALDEVKKAIPGIIPQIVKSVVDEVDRELKDKIRQACTDNINKIFESFDFEAYVKNSFALELRQINKQKVVTKALSNLLKKNAQRVSKKSKK